jgi:hypothetical protein
MSRVRYLNPPGIDSIAVGRLFEDCLAARHGLVLLPCSEDQLAHGDARSGDGTSPIYHELKHDPHSRYGHLMIEVAANRLALKDRWYPGGIYAESDAHYYWHGDERIYWRFAKPDLIQWAFEKGVDLDTVRSFCLGAKHPLISSFQGTMARMQMEYFEADAIGKRFKGWEARWPNTNR